ncbi:MAG: iron-containing alcohol dehydrogenase [bacterium]|nr:iron-containing alcohol dehydrogenase [Candidatus Colisoma equi]
MQKNCFSYPIEFAEDAFGESDVLANTLRKVTGSDEPKVLIVADMNVVQRIEGLGTKIGHYVQEHGIRLAGSPVVIAGGEKIKADNLQSALKIVSEMLQAKIGCNDVVLAIGGGTLLDVAGYAAAQVRGGVKLVRMPTTPAAMMSAAYADYAAVDSATVKDALRVPSVPAAVVIDTTFATSVLDGVWRGGIGEAVRLAVAADAALLKKVEAAAEGYRNRDMSAFAEIVGAVHAVRAKKGGTQFAQWAALRLESMSGYKLPHGYSVPIGLCIDLGYAVEKGLLKAKDRDRVVGLLRSCGALDGLLHSGHLVGQADSLLCGIDAWMLTFGDAAFPVCVGIGKLGADATPDREIYRQVLKDLPAASAGE